MSRIPFRTVLLVAPGIQFIGCTETFLFNNTVRYARQIFHVRVCNQQMLHWKKKTPNTEYVAWG